MIIEIVIRYPYQKTAKEGVKTDRRVSRTEDILLGLMTVFMLVLTHQAFQSRKWRT